MSTAGDRQTALADTNVFIALLAGEGHPLHERALNIFRRVAEGELVLIVMPVIVAELVYAAGPVLGWTRAETVSRVSGLLQADGLAVRESAVLLSALELLARRPKMDFPDAYLAAAGLQGEPAVVASFDSDFDGIAGLERLAA